MRSIRVRRCTRNDTHSKAAGATTGRGFITIESGSLRLRKFSTKPPRWQNRDMDEAFFWTSLEFRICGEFAGMPERRYRIVTSVRWLCADPIHSTVRRLASRGQRWICNGPEQAEWDFVLILPGPVPSREEIDCGRCTLRQERYPLDGV